MTEQFESDKKLWIRLLKNDMVRGLFMLAPSFFGGLNFLALLGSAKILEGTFHFDSKLYSDIKTQRHAQSVDRIPIGSEFSTDTMFTTRVQESYKQSAELNTVKEEIASKFEDQQEFDKHNSPTVSYTSHMNSDPRNIREKLATAFHKTRMVSWTTQLSQDRRFVIRESDFRKIVKNNNKVKFQEQISEVEEIIKEALLNIKDGNLIFPNVWGEELYDPNYVLLNFKRDQVRFQAVLEENVFITETTRKVLESISDRFYGGEELVAVMPDGTFLPLEEIHSKWLYYKAYSSNSYIFVIPARFTYLAKDILFEPTSADRFRVELDLFMDEVLRNLDGLEFEEEIESGNLRRISVSDGEVYIEEKALDGVWEELSLYRDEKISLLFGFNKGFMENTKSRIKNGRQVGISKNSFFEILSRLEGEIIGRSLLIRASLISRLERSFKNYYMKVYHSSIDPHIDLYYTMSAFSSGIRAVLYQAGITSSMMYEELNGLDLESKILSNLVFTVSKLRLGKQVDVKPNLWVELYAELKNRFGNIMEEKGVLDLFEQLFIDLFNEIQQDLIPSGTENTIRGAFIRKILDIFPKGSFISRGSLSWLLFRDKWYYSKKFISQDVVYSSIHSLVYDRIEENIMEGLDQSDFDFFAQLLSQKDLNIIKDKIGKIIATFRRIYSADRTSIGEEFTKEVLRYLLNNPKSPYKDLVVESAWPEWLVNPKTGRIMELDVFIEELGFAVEFNGPYHNNPELVSRMFDISIEEATQKVAAVAAKDKFKAEECKRRGFELLVLKYTLSSEEIYETCRRFVANLLNRRHPELNIDFNDFNLDWRLLLKDVKRIRVENIMKRFNVERVIEEEFEDL